MGKMKTRKSITRRFKLTATGKILRRRSFSRHLRAKKSKGQKAEYKRTRILTGAIAKKIARFLK